MPSKPLVLVIFLIGLSIYAQDSMEQNPPNYASCSAFIG
jgi:hypothetical protein